MGTEIVNFTQGSQDWLNWRGKGVGASEVPALLDRNPHFTKRDLWFEKSGLGSINEEGNEWIFNKGHQVEKKLREEFEAQTKIEMKPVCMEKDDIFLCSLDGFDKSMGILEAKYVGKKILAAAKKGEIPEHHKIQIQDQLHISEADKAWWCGHDGKNSIAVEIGRDESLIKQITAEVPLFWEMVLNSEMPELTSKDTYFITNPSDRELFAKLVHLKRKKDEIESQYKEVEGSVKALADHPKIQCGNVTITTFEKKGSVSWKSVPQVKTLKNEYLEQFRSKPSIQKRITFKESK